MRRNGFTLIELVIAMAIFGMFLIMLATLSTEMRGQEKRYPVNFMSHPQIMTVLARLRRDVLDAFGQNPYDNYPQSSQTLTFDTIVGGGVQKVTWDFSKPGEVHRISYNVGIATEWVARGLPPDFVATIDAVEIPGHPFGVHITAIDSKGRLSIDQYLQPRVHQ